MVEMLGVLAVIGILTVGGIAGYSKAVQKYRVNKLTSQITQTIANVQTLFAQQSNYENLSFFKELVIPEEARAFLDIDSQYPNYDVFVVGYDYYNSIYGRENGDQYCVALASMDWKSALGDSLVGISMSRFVYYLTINDISGAMESYEGDLYNSAYYIGADNLPMSLSKAVQYCKYGDDNISGFTVHIKK